MRSRRQFLYLSGATLLAVVAERALRHAADSPSTSLAPASAAVSPHDEAMLASAPGQPAAPVWLPFAQTGQRPLAATPTLEPATTPTSTPSAVYLPIAGDDFNADDPPLLGPPSGTAQQAVDWLAARAVSYTPEEITAIVAEYVK